MMMIIIIIMRRRRRRRRSYKAVDIRDNDTEGNKINTMSPEYLKFFLTQNILAPDFFLF